MPQAALVIHGTDDPLVRVSGGRATAEAVPRALLVEIEGMGHDLPRALSPEITEADRGCGCEGARLAA